MKTMTITEFKNKYLIKTMSEMRTDPRDSTKEIVDSIRYYIIDRKTNKVNQTFTLPTKNGMSDEQGFYEKIITDYNLR